MTNARGASGWVNPQALAASWDLDLVSREYSAMAAEFRDKGYSMLLGPISGPLGRSPFSGRLYESFVGAPVDLDLSIANYWSSRDLTPT